MPTFFTVSPGMTVTDVALNATGNIINWGPILDENPEYDTWVPLFNGGEILTIPDNAVIDANNLNYLAGNPATNNSYDVYPLIDALFNTLNGYAANLITVPGSDYTAAPGSTGNMVYALQVVNLTASTLTITDISGSIFGTALSADIAASGLKFYKNSQPSLSGSPALLEIDTPTGTSQYDFSYSGLAISVPGRLSVYIVATVDIASGATPGDVIGMQAGLNPVVLTITGAPAQNNEQENISGVITITS